MFNYYHVLAFLIQSYKYVHCAMIFSRRNLCGVSIMHCRKNDKILRSRKTCKNRRLYFEGAYKIIRLQLGVYILPFCIFNILSWNAPFFKYPSTFICHQYHCISDDVLNVEIGWLFGWATRKSTDRWLDPFLP